MPRKKEERTRNPKALGVAGFTLGIVSIILFIFSPLMGVIVSIVGFFLCLKQQSREKTRAARVGIILNIIGFVVNVAFWLVSVYWIYPNLNSLYSVNGSYP